MKHLAKNHRKRRRNRWFLCSILLSFSRLVDCHAPTAAEEDELPPIATSTVPMHAVSGTHHIYVYIGSPPKRQTLIVDTGSRIMAFPCDPCKNCGRHTSPTYYSPLESTTDVQLPCDRCHYDMSKCVEKKCALNQGYAEGSSWSGYEVEDLIWFGTETLEESVERHLHLAVPYSFACQYREDGLFQEQYADGIMGLAIHESSIIHSFFEEGSILRVAFSLCVTRHGGYMSLGGIRTRSNHFTPMQFVPLQSGRYYKLPVISVHLNHISLTDDPVLLYAFTDSKGTLLDSGTTDTYLPHVISPLFQQVWKEITGLVYSNKRHQYTYDQFRSLPNVTIGLTGSANIVIQPDSYMEQQQPQVTGGGAPPTSQDSTGTQPSSKIPWDGVKEFTNRIYCDEPRGAVLGMNAMIGHDILFDLEGMRLGIAPADCS
mmetsp:Transcript_9206/g.16697  ORF Transcript_9206/g.16697 Transcript_9206/m.16697 type:complete len:429 (-) Transcript_9206:686-1972(-)|eukprot:CAMPEP_0198292908 /NCGR_PEP_ID=MMETSP1449-20131203/14676_1 /TAXON_ID=420275 /ORGANISM="Attheya septentrionalis, Strain CCMP2084" /LENGTH=428 /DNA_ID=CAMNT_0043992263 /DNA_START=99 /DNA_END=1385 /DNA_ORIENTATION=-